MNRKTGDQSVSEKLERAREYEKNRQNEISSEEKPVFHITPPIGWMNDPNGLCQFHGINHIMMGKFICFISTILIQESGDRCTGDTVSPRI